MNQINGCESLHTQFGGIVDFLSPRPGRNGSGGSELFTVPPGLRKGVARNRFGRSNPYSEGLEIGYCLLGGIE